MVTGSSSPSLTGMMTLALSISTTSMPSTVIGFISSTPSGSFIPSGSLNPSGSLASTMAAPTSSPELFSDPLEGRLWLCSFFRCHWREDFWRQVNLH